MAEIVGDDGNAFTIQSTLHRRGDDGSRDRPAPLVPDEAKEGGSGIDIGAPAFGQLVEEVAAIGGGRDRHENTRREGQSCTGAKYRNRLLHVRLSECRSRGFGPRYLTLI